MVVTSELLVGVAVTFKLPVAVGGTGDGVVVAPVFTGVGIGRPPPNLSKAAALVMLAPSPVAGEPGSRAKSRLSGSPSGRTNIGSAFVPIVCPCFSPH